MRENQSDSRLLIRAFAASGAAVAAISVGLTYSERVDAAPRPAPSGDTCREKVAYYATQGALFGKIKPSDCKDRPHLGNNLVVIESAGRFFDYNPIGAVAVSACESGLTETAVGIIDSRDKGLFQQHSPYWSGRLDQTQDYINSRSKKGTSYAQLSHNILNPRSNAFVSVFMLRRGGGTTHWAPSEECWSAKYDEVAGSQTRLQNWFATAKNTESAK